MRKLKTLIVLYIGTVSIILASLYVVAIINSDFKVNNILSFIAELSLTILGILILVIYLIKRIKLKTSLLVIWWLPQLISVLIKTIDVINNSHSIDVLYQVKVLFDMTIGMGWVLTSGSFLTINFNLIAILGVILVIVVMSKESKKVDYNS